MTLDIEKRMLPAKGQTTSTTNTHCYADVALHEVTEGDASPLLAIQQFRRVVLYITYVGADLEGFHLICRKRAQ